MDITIDLSYYLTLYHTGSVPFWTNYNIIHNSNDDGNDDIDGNKRHFFCNVIYKCYLAGKKVKNRIILSLPPALMAQRSDFF